MAGVNPPNNERMLQLLGDLDARLRAVETQQQQTITDSQGRPVINFGLIPGSSPARYGMQFLAADTGAEELFIGENTGGTYGVVFTVGSDGVIESANFAAGSAGFQLLPNGDASFNQLTLKAGIVGDDALTNPVAAGQADATQASINFTGSHVAYASTSIAVPSGFTQAYVMATATAGVTANASGAIIDCLPVIGGNNGQVIAIQGGANIAVSVSSTYSVALTGLGSSISLNCSAEMQAGGQVSGSGNARISALALFLR